jgi:hypothetical protein
MACEEKKHLSRGTADQISGCDVKKNLFKGEVSPDIAFYFRVYKFKSVLSVRPLMVIKFIYFLFL